MSDKWIARAPVYRICAFIILGAILNLIIKPSVAFQLRIPYVGCNNASPKDSYSLQTEVSVWKRSFDRIERSWLNEWTISRHLGQSDAEINWCWQESVNNGRYQCQNGSGWPSNTVEWNDTAIVRGSVTAPIYSLWTIYHIVPHKCPAWHSAHDWESKINALTDHCDAYLSHLYIAEFY